MVTRCLVCCLAPSIPTGVMRHAPFHSLVDGPWAIWRFGTLDRRPFPLLWLSGVEVLHLSGRPSTGQNSARILHYFTLDYNRTHKTPSNRLIELPALYRDRGLGLSGSRSLGDGTMGVR